MHFQLRKLVLWPKRDLPPREIEFQVGQVNIISGASKTGKSAVVPIVDYCLGANRCAIPVGVIRDACAWFGIVVSTVEGEKLIARREPRDHSQSGDMFIIEGDSVELPAAIVEKNSTVQQVKTMLNTLAGITSLGMRPDAEGYGENKASFRDLMAFTFQPQNIVANPDVLYFKADTTEHREKLKAIFPYILNAVNAETLALRWELDRLQRLLRQKEAALRDAMSTVEIWIGEATSWIRHAKELGLIVDSFQVSDEWTDILGVLRELAKTNYRDAVPTIGAIEGVLSDLASLQAAEAEEAERLSKFRQRLMEIRRLIDSSRSYGDAIYIQRDRLSISEWLRGISEESGDAISAAASKGLSDLHKLCDALSGLELELRSQATISDKLDSEQLRLRSLAEESITKLNEVRLQVRDLERRSEEARAEAFRADHIERFLGRLEQALKLYEKAGQDADLRREVDDLRDATAELKARISEQQIQRSITNALTAIQNIAGQIVATLDAEWPDAAIKLVIQDLTLKVVQGTRDDYLWEIGSGANWLAYHVAVTLAYQRFFLEFPHHPVPSFLVYDQPSQAYFPKGAGKGRDDEVDWQDEDVIAVRKVFRAFSEETRVTTGRLQIIVLDHADEKVWGDIDNTYLVAEWRGGEKLVPKSWLADS